MAEFQDHSQFVCDYSHEGQLHLDTLAAFVDECRKRGVSEDSVVHMDRGRLTVYLK